MADKPIYVNLTVDDRNGNNITANGALDNPEIIELVKTLHEYLMNKTIDRTFPI